MTWRYALFLGAVFGLSAAIWVERQTVGALAGQVADRGALAFSALSDGVQRWHRGEGNGSGSDGSAQLDLPMGADGEPQPQPMPMPEAPPLPEQQATSEPSAPSTSPATQLDGLFAALRRSDSAEDAQRIEADIYLRLSQASSPTVNLMMNSAAVTAEDQGQEAARTIYQRVTQLEPGYAEGWARAAGAAFEAGELDEAERLLRTAVRLEPRHYAAWTGLGAVLEAKGDAAGAVAAYREALFYNPWQDSAKRGLLRAETASKGLPM